MKSVVKHLIAVCIAMSVLPVWALQVRDDRGVTVNLPSPPKRIVTTLPSLTETVCELGACQRLVGVDRYSNYPASVRGLPQVGGGIDPHVEAIVALKPDVVLMAVSSRAVERLESLGIKVVALEPKNAADVQRVLGVVGEVLAVADAQRVWREIDAGVRAAALSISARSRATRVYFEVNQGPYAAGASSFMGEMLTRLGVQNIIPAELGPFPKINPEFVVRANHANGLAQRPGWGSIRAMREKHVCLFTTDESDVLVRPGPRMADAARLMARCILQHAP
jgi:iron complex transport system substrate-binding protein